MCQHAVHALMLMFQYALCVSMLTCQHALHANMPCMLMCSCANISCRPFQKIFNTCVAKKLRPLLLYSTYELIEVFITFNKADVSLFK